MKRFFLLKKIRLILCSSIFFLICLFYIYSSGAIVQFGSVNSNSSSKSKVYFYNHNKGKNVNVGGRGGGGDFGIFLNASSSVNAVFERGVDGDTLEVRDIVNKDLYRVRIIGINAPESVDPHRKPECFGKESSIRLSSLFKSGDVLSLSHDNTQDYIDVFGRTLAYVLFNEKDVGLELIKEGYAREFTWDVKKPYSRQFLYKEAEQWAKSQMVGFWGKCR